MLEEKDDALSPADAAAVDAVLGGETDSASPRDTAREQRAREWLGLIGRSSTPAAPGDLLQRTLAAVQAAGQADRMKVTSERAAAHAGAKAQEKEIGTAVRRRWSRRLAEVGSMGVAAAILLVVGILAMGEIEKSKARTACAENLQKWSTAFQAYAVAYSGQLPELTPPANGNWLMNMSDTGAKTNVMNLAPLFDAKAGGSALKMANVYCPGNLPVADVRSEAGSISAEGWASAGYSYTHLYGATKPSWDGRVETLVLADKNPLFLPPEKAVTNPDKNSLNHAGRGNYLLHADGSVTWEQTPNVGPGGDNIWTVTKGGQVVTAYLGVESPSGARDMFLVP